MDAFIQTGRAREGDSGDTIANRASKATAVSVGGLGEPDTDTWRKQNDDKA
jgi:hypothetical protein